MSIASWILGPLALLPGSPQTEEASVRYLEKVAELHDARAPAGVERDETEQVHRRSTHEVEGEDAIHLLETRWYESSRNLSEMVMRDNTIGLVYPGALLWTGALREGIVEPLVGLPSRPPVQVAFAGIAGDDLNFTHDGSFFDFQGQLLARKEGLRTATPRLEVNITYGKSLESALLRAGLSARFWSAKLSVEGSHTESSARSFAVLSLDQVYFSLVADWPEEQGHLPPSLLDRNAVAASYVLSTMDRHGEPGYVRKVDYGRRVILSLTSTASEEELRAAMRFSAKGGPFSVQADAEAAARKVWAKTEARAVVIGGEVTDGLIDALTGSFDGFLTNVNTFLKETKEYSPQTGAAPVSFEVRYCSDNEGFANFETVEFSGQFPLRDFKKGATLTRKTSVQLTSEDATLLRQDWELDTDDWTGVDLRYQLSVSADRRAVDLYLRMDAMERERDKRYKGKTHIRTEKTLRIYEVPASDPRKIARVEAKAPAASAEKLFRGELHDWFTYGDGVLGALRDIKVHVDGPGRDDKKHQGLRAELNYKVVLDRERP